ncbi:MAG: molecular chaperone HscC, partial [Spirochaetae bacterium HGW-Spirochaetae-10]
MGTDAQYTIRKDRFNSIELSSMVLKSLKADAERLFGFEVNRAVITVPAYFSEAQRQATRKAGEMAGLTVERILNEPTAAAIAYGLQKQADVHRFLIFDLGGGTFDVCVMEHDEGILETLSVAGISQLGGEDFSHALLNYVLKKEGQDFDRLLSRSPETAGLMMKRAELAKQQLSTNDTVPLAISGSPLREKTIQITREEADEVFAPLIRRLATPCQTALRGASTKISNLDAVVLVGGATRMPCVRNFIEDYFETEALAIVDPDLT